MEWRLPCLFAVNLFLTDIVYDPVMEQRLSSIQMSGDGSRMERKSLKRRLPWSGDRSFDEPR